MTFRCLRCNRILTSKESIKRKYGKTCFRIVNSQKPKQEINETVEFMKLELKMLKRQINELKIHGIKQSDTIERLKQDKIQVQTVEKVNFSNVMSELKDIFNKTNGNWKKILKPINSNFYI